VQPPLQLGRQRACRRRRRRRHLRGVRRRLPQLRYNNGRYRLRTLL
jgi:hypothetical protein